MRRSTALFLVTGCALVLFLAAPDALSALDQGCQGPYAEPHPLEAPPPRSSAARPEPERRPPEQVARDLGLGPESG